ncbi:MAG: hypothetical protein JO288_01740 [Hyphomicrobiales bacterium]|nr:hypothetical protein [Hyphomicrobiales bacterium]
MMHVVMHVMHVMHVMYVVMMMVMIQGRRFDVSGRGALGRRFLGEGVTRKADGESGCGDKTLDHGSTFLNEEDPFGLHGAKMTPFA